MEPLEHTHRWARRKVRKLIAIAAARAALWVLV